METTHVCKSCQNPISETYFFCPYCGKKLRNLPLSTSIAKQIGVYTLAVFLPFLTIVPGIMYVRQLDSRSKAVGVVTLLLTAISFLVNAYFFVIFYRQFEQLINGQLGL